MRQMKWLTPFILLVTTIFILSGCGTLTEKPTGLEDRENEQLVEKDKISETDNGKELVNDDAESVAGDVKDEHENKVDKNADEKKTNKDQKNSDSNVGDENSTSDNDTEQKNKSSSAKNSETKDGQKEKASTKEKSKNKTEQKSNDSSNKNSSNKNNGDSQSSKKSTTTKDNNQHSKDSNTSKPESDDSKSTIVHSIVISSNEVPLPPTELEIEDGDTVLDALIAITMEHEVHMDYRGGQGATAYVQGMGNVYEFDRGSGSGWMYSVNGIFPDRGAGVVPLMDGDRVEWKYTTNLGEDLNADLKPFRR